MKRAKPGDVLPVKGGYPYELPNGIKAGTLARLVSFDHGYWTVEVEGRTFRVFLTQVESGWLYELNGRWLEADDPRVIAMRAETSLKGSPAYSCVAGACVNPPLPI